MRRESKTNHDCRRCPLTSDGLLDHSQIMYTTSRDWAGPCIPSLSKSSQHTHSKRVTLSRSHTNAVIQLVLRFLDDGGIGSDMKERLWWLACFGVGVYPSHTKCQTVCLRNNSCIYIIMYTSSAWPTMRSNWARRLVTAMPIVLQYTTVHQLWPHVALYVWQYIGYHDSQKTPELDVFMLKLCHVYM